MPDVIIKTLPAIRVAELTGYAASFEPDGVTSVIQPLYADLHKHLVDAGVTPTGPMLAYYTDPPNGREGIIVHAAAPVSPEVPMPPKTAADGYAVVDLPAVPRAATILHHGSMEHIMPTVQTLARWIEDNGYRSAAYPRENYLECPDDLDGWVTELQEPLT